MREFLKLFFLLAIPAFILVIGLTYLFDRNRFNQEAERANPKAIAERVSTASKMAELRSTDLGQRASAASASVPHQIYREMKDAFASLDKAIQKSLSGTFGFSPAGAELASILLTWATIFLTMLAAGFSLFNRWAPASVRQKLITGNHGASARTGGAFELPH